MDDRGAQTTSWDPEWDRAMVTRFQGGDRVAFDLLYRRYHEQVVRWCRSLLAGDAGAAEEAAQEAFARAFRALPTLDGPRHFYPWVRVIARRVCVDEHRRRRRACAGVSRLGTLAVDDGDQDPASNAADAADGALAIAALGRLPSRYQTVLRLRDIEGRSAREAATTLGTSPGAVDVLVTRARRALRRQFAELGGVHAGAVGVLGALTRRLRGAAARGRSAVAQTVHRASRWVPDGAWEMVGTMAVAGAVAFGAGHSPAAPGAATETPTRGVAVPPPSLVARATSTDQAVTGAGSLPATTAAAPARSGPRPGPSERFRFGPFVMTDREGSRPPPDAPIVVEVPGVGGMWLDPQAAVDAVTCRVGRAAGAAPC